MNKKNLGFDKREARILRRINTPKKIQDFITSLEINFEEKGDTCMSPKMVLRTRKAHCIESALLAATALRFHGYPPLVVDMEANKSDYDHVIAVFRHGKFWGAISKSNYAGLRYREPVYCTIHELVMSYFHEYFNNHTGKKTLRAYSSPVNLSRFDSRGWMTLEGDVWFIAEYLADVKHYPILNQSQIKGLRKADRIEVKAGSLFEWRKPKKINRRR